MLFITGASGSGKSSLAQAGVLPALEAHYLARGLFPKRAVFRPAKRPLDMLADALLQLGLPRSDLLVHQVAMGTPAAFAAFVSSSTPDDQINLAVIDQFEELFSQAEERQREILIAILSALPLFRSLRTHFLVTLRSDYLGELFHYRALYDLAKQGIDLREMDEIELRASIERPLQVRVEADPTYRGKTWEPALVAELARQATASATSLPLLQLTLQELWRRGHLIFAAYHEMGGTLTSAIKDRATIILEYADYDRSRPTVQRSEADREDIIRIFLDLVHVNPSSGAGHPDVRRRRAFDELVGDTANPAATARDRLVEDLVKARLLSKERQGETDYVDIIHESLIANWDRLQQAIAADREMLQQRARFEQAFTDWQNNAGDLLTGMRLADARALEERHDIALRGLAAREFLEQSKARYEADLAQRRIAEAQQLAQTLRQQADDAVKLLPAQPVEALIRAVRAVGLNLDASPDRLLPSVQMSLHAVLQAAKERKVFTGHRGSVRAVAFSPRGDVLVSGSDDRTVRLWDVRGTQELPPLEGHQDSVTAVAISSDGQTILSGSADRTLRLWAPDGRRLTALLTGHRDSVTAVAFHPQADILASASDDGTVRLWDFGGSQLVCMRGHQGSVTSVVFSPDGQTVASAGIDGTLRLWNLRGRPLGRPFEGHEDFVATLAYHPAGDLIVSGGGDVTIRVWDLKGREFRPPLEGHEGFINALAFSPGGDALVSASDDRTIRIWDLGGGQIGEPLYGHGHVVTSLSVGPNAALIASGGGDRTVRLWEWRMASGRTPGQFSSEAREPTLMACRRPSREIQVWDVYGDQIGPGWRGAANFVRTVAVTPNAEILSGGSEGTVRVWDFDGHDMASARGHAGTVTSLAVSFDGRTVVSGGRDRTIRRWDMRGNPIGEPFEGHKDDVNAVAFTPDGELVVSGSNDCTLLLWDLTGRRVAGPFEGHKDYVSAVAVSSRGRIVSASGDGTLLLWDLTGRRVAGPFEGHSDAVNAVAFSPDGELLLSGGADGTVRLWDLAGNEIGEPLRGHSDRVEAVTFSPDGQIILSAGKDATIRQWDRQGNPIVRPFRTRRGGLLAAAFSPDGTLVVTGGADGILRVWRAGNWRNWLATACARLRDHAVLDRPGSVEGEICRRHAWSELSHPLEMPAG